jgi:hypothetical protein
MTMEQDAQTGILRHSWLAVTPKINTHEARSQLPADISA